MTRLLSCLFVITALAACSSDCCSKKGDCHKSHHEKAEGFCENCPKDPAHDKKPADHNAHHHSH